MGVDFKFTVVYGCEIEESAEGSFSLVDLNGCDYFEVDDKLIVGKIIHRSGVYENVCYWKYNEYHVDTEFEDICYEHLNQVPEIHCFVEVC